MMRCHNNVLCFARIYCVLNEITALVVLHIESFAINHNAIGINTVEIIHTSLCCKSILWFYMPPKSCNYKVSIFRKRYDSIIIIFHIGTHCQAPPIIEPAQVKTLVELMIARHDHYLHEMLGRPSPKRMLEKTFITQISHITSQDQNVGNRLNWMALQVQSILHKL